LAIAERQDKGRPRTEGKVREVEGQQTHPRISPSRRRRFTPPPGSHFATFESHARAIITREAPSSEDLAYAYEKRIEGEYGKAAETFKRVATFYSEEALPNSGASLETRIANCTKAAGFADRAVECYENCGMDNDAGKMMLLSETIVNVAGLQESFLESLKTGNMNLIMSEVERLSQVLEATTNAMRSIQNNNYALVFITNMQKQYTQMHKSGELPQADIHD